ncbi:MAG: radical SAM protein [Candidatus Berkelbacteria bacterium]
MLRSSRFLHTYAIPSGVVLYHALRVKSALVEVEQHQKEAVWQDPGLLLEMLDENSINQLKTEGYFVEKDEDQQLLEKARKEASDVYIHTMYLILSEGCNLACRYCFFEEEMPQPSETSLMSVATVKRALDMFAKWAAKDFKSTILLYGGNPLLNMLALKFSIEYTAELVAAGSLHPDTEVAIVSNGTLVDDDFVSFIKQHQGLATVSVSLDGPRDIHDRWRVDFADQGSFDQAIGGYRLLHNAGLRPGISCTLPPNNLAAIDEITAWIVEMKPGGVSFNAMADTCKIKMDRHYAEAVAKAISRAFMVLREEGIYEDRMMRKVKAFAQSEWYLKDCAGYGEQVVIAPDGEIGICHAHVSDRKFFRGNVNDANPLDPHTDLTFREWAIRSPINFPACRECAGLGICGGGCAHNAEVRHGGIWQVDDQVCPHVLTTLKWMIEETYS